MDQEWNLIHLAGVEQLPWLELHSNDNSTRCDMTVNLRRNPSVYLVENAMLDLLVVSTGLGATLMNPTSPFFGARCGMLMTSMLMTSALVRVRTRTHSNRRTATALVSRICRTMVDSVRTDGMTHTSVAVNKSARRDLRFGRLGCAPLNAPT